MTWQFLGWQMVGGMGWRPVWVIWLGDWSSPLKQQIPDEFICGHCKRANDGAKVRRIKEVANPAVNSVSVSCACGATVHFDKTPSEQRPHLTWTAQYRPVLDEREGGVSYGDDQPVSPD